MVRQMRRVAFDAEDEGRRPSRQPAQPKEVEPGHIGDAAPMHRRAAFVERVDLQPAEIERVSRRPDDGGYSGLVEVELKDGVGDACRLRFDRSRRRLLGQVRSGNNGRGARGSENLGTWIIIVA